MTSSPPTAEDLLPELTTDLLIKRPIKALNRKLKIDGFGLFKGLSKGVADYGMGKAWAIPADLIEAIAAIKIEDLDVSERAWLLIYRSLMRGATELLEPSIRLLNPTESTKDAIHVNLDATLSDTVITINQDFFKRPEEISVLPAFQELLYQWLTEWGLAESRARTVVDRLPIFFVTSLHEEWRERSGDYAPIEAAFKTPFLAASENLLEWERYYSSVQKKVQEAMFQETFSLSQVYVPLRGYYQEKKKNAPEGDLSNLTGGNGEMTHVAIELRGDLDIWFEKREKNDALRVISGGPGSGKSSFARMWAADLTKQMHTRVLFIELHRIDLKSNLEDAIGNLLRKSGIFRRNPLDLDDGEKLLLLIFDGLDEIAEQGKASAELATSFVTEVEKMLGQRNQNICQLQALITGRELVVQTSITHFRPRRILHVLPYKITGNEHEIKEKYQDEKGLLEEDQRQAWWRNYNRATGKEEEGLPEPLHRADLEEVTKEPLLNYLVALSYDRKSLDFTKKVSLNRIYADLLENVHAGVHNEDRGPVPELNCDQFGKILEEVALAVWHGSNQRTATVAEIEAHCKKSGADLLLADFREKAKSNVTQLLVAFYFREQGRNATGEKSFEFTHKSFGEYLTARRIVSELDFLYNEIERRRSTGRSGLNEIEALERWVEVCGPTSMDDYLVAFLAREITLKGAKAAKKWQGMLCQLIEAMLLQGMPMEKIEGNLDFKSMSHQSRNAEEALLVALSCCAETTGEKSNISWPNSSTLGSWMHRLHPQEKSFLRPLALGFFNYLDLSGCILHLTNMYHPNLKNCVAKNAHFIYSTFFLPRFTNADLQHADFSGCRVIHGDFKSANLEGCYLRDIHVTSSDFEEAILEAAHGRGAHFKDVNFRGANFEGSSFRASNFEGSNFQGANLKLADLTHSNIKGANFKGANIEGMKLYKTRVAKGQLEGAIGTPDFDPPKDDKVGQLTLDEDDA